MERIALPNREKILQQNRKPHIKVGQTYLFYNKNRQGRKYAKYNF